MWSRPAEPQIAAYRWPNGSAKVDKFAEWLGRDPVWGEDFVGGETWSNVGWPVFWLDHWSGWLKGKPGRVLLLGIPLLAGPVDLSGPTQGDEAGQPVSLEKAATGAYNHHFRALAENLVKRGMADKVILRLGWEFNGGWYAWRAKDHAAQLAEYWRRIVRTMRAVPGGEAIRFCWNPTLGYQQFPAEQAWPGDEWVDFIGVDVYDDSWQADTYPWPAGTAAPEIAARRQKVWDKEIFGGDHGLAFWAKFAREHHKPLCVPEWGVDDRPEKHGGLDNAYFVEQMHRFITDPGNHVAFHCYFDVEAPDGKHQLSPGENGIHKTEFPEAAKKFKELFGR